jgi:hypothetical protein
VKQRRGIDKAVNGLEGIDAWAWLVVYLDLTPFQLTSLVVALHCVCSILGILELVATHID